MYTMRFDLRPLRLTTGWSEPNAVVSRTLSVVVEESFAIRVFCRCTTHYFHYKRSENVTKT